MVYLSCFTAGGNYLIGKRGGIVCPSGSQLVTNKKECRVEAAVALNKKYGGAGCFFNKAIGCLDNMSAVWFSTCQTCTASNHGPICREQGEKRNSYAIHLLAFFQRM